MVCKKYVKSFIYNTLLIVVVLLAAACSLKPISAIQIVGNPKVSVPLGSKMFTADEYLSAKSLEEALTKDSSNKRIRVYDYIDRDTSHQLRYLLHYSHETIDFELGNNFDVADLTHEMSTSFPIPKIEQQAVIEIPVKQINDSLLSAFNQGAQKITIPVPVPQALLPQQVDTNGVKLTFHGFKTLTFGTDPDTVLKITSESQTLQYEVISATMQTNGVLKTGRVSDNKNVVFDLSGQTISNELTLQFKVKITGGSGDISIQPKLSGKIAKATGITQEIPAVTLVNNASISLPLPDQFKSAKIGTGSLQLSMVQPSGWQNITIKKKLTIKQGGSGGLSITPSDFTPFAAPVDLKDQTLNNDKTLTYSAVASISLKDAVYTAETDAVPVTLLFAIQEFKEITLTTTFETEKTQTIAVPVEMKKWIKTVNFAKVSAEVTLDNGLPAGNPIGITLASQKLHINEETHSFPAGQSSSHTYSSTSDWTLDVEHTDAFEVKTKIQLPNYKPVEKTVTLHNIPTGKDIAVTAAVKFDLDWKTITVKAQTNQKSSFPKENGAFYDLSAITKVLEKAKLKLPEVPLYFYVGSPLFEGTDINASIKFAAEYKQQNSETVLNMPFVDLSGSGFKLRCLETGALPAVGSNTFEGEVPKAAFTLKKGEQGVSHTFADLLNEYPAGLRLNYETSMNELTVSREKYEELKKKNGKVELRVDILIDIPVEFEISGSGELLLNEVAELPANRDLFGRTGNSNISPLDGVMESVNSIMLKISLKNTSGIEPVCVLRAKDASGANIIDDKIIDLKNGSSVMITFTKEEWQKILNTVPFSPQLYLKLGNQPYVVKKGAELAITLSVEAEAKIDHTIQL